MLSLDFLMPPSTEYTDYILELLEPLGSVRSSRFFGGVGLAYDAVQFAMIMENTLYFVVDDDTRQPYEVAGMQPFSYLTKKGRIQVRRYVELPEDVLTDPEQLRHWAREAIRVARKTSKPKTGKP
jgi:DNA transformation protein